MAAAPASAAGTGVIGDLVWNDSDRNGIQNAGEAGIPGVTVHLQQQIAGAWVEVGTTTTNANGSYSFTLLDAATFRLRFELVDGMVFSPFRANPPGTSVSFARDSDVQDFATGLTAPVDLAPGQTNNTIDAGMYALPLELTKDVVGTPVVADDLTTSVAYDLTVTNTSPNPGLYDLSDTFRFPTAVTVTDVTTESVAPADLPLSATFDGAADPVLLTDQSIAGGATHTIRIVVDATVRRDISYDFRGCEELSSDWRTGFLNDAALTSYGNQLTASACASIDMPPNPLGAVSITKEVLDPDGVLAGASFDVSYAVFQPGDDGVPIYELDLLADEPQLITGLPVGTRISFNEPTATLPTLPTGYTWNEAVFAPGASVTVETACTTESCEAEALPVTLTNSYTAPETPATGGFTITKVVEGDGVVPADTAYSFAYTLGDAAPVTVEILAGEPLEVADVPAGTVVTLAEGELPDVDGVAWGEPSFAVDGVVSGADAELTVTAGERVAVVLTNTADLAENPTTTPSPTDPTTTEPPTGPATGPSDPAGPGAGSQGPGPGAGTGGLVVTGADTAVGGVLAGLLLVAGAGAALLRRRLEAARG